MPPPSALLLLVPSINENSNSLYSFPCFIINFYYSHYRISELINLNFNNFQICVVFAFTLVAFIIITTNGKVVVPFTQSHAPHPGRLHRRRLVEHNSIKVCHSLNPLLTLSDIHGFNFRAFIHDFRERCIRLRCMHRMFRISEEMSILFSSTRSRTSATNNVSVFSFL